MADGRITPIAEVEVGDWVLAADPESGERGPRQVTAVWVHQDQLVDLELDGGVVTTTEDHPFWNASDRQWQRADELGAGQTVLTADGELAGVEGIDWATRTGGIAYNLTVADLHTYFVVVGDEDVLVHNKCVNLSAWNNMTKNWNHIFNQHMPGGSTGNNTLFLGMTENQVKGRWTRHTSLENEYERKTESTAMSAC